MLKCRRWLFNSVLYVSTFRLVVGSRVCCSADMEMRDIFIERQRS